MALEDMNRYKQEMEAFLNKQQQQEIQGNNHRGLANNSAPTSMTMQDTNSITQPTEFDTGAGNKRNVNQAETDQREELRILMEILPIDVQLKIYDSFLNLRSFERQELIDSFLQILNNEDNEVEDITEEIPFNVQELPDKIRYSYELIDRIQDAGDYGWLSIEKRVFSFADYYRKGNEIDNVEDIEDDPDRDITFYKLRFGDDIGEYYALYDAKTLQCMIALSNERFRPLQNLPMEIALKYEIDKQIINMDEEYVHGYDELVHAIDAAGVCYMPYSDAFTHLRSILHSLCSSSNE